MQRYNILQNYLYLCQRKKETIGMITLENIRISYGSKELFEPLSLQIPKGRLFCISGISGCGKSSLLKAILGFIPLEGGTITIGDTLLSEKTVNALRKRVSWLPQELALPMEWVSEMVQLPFELKSHRDTPYIYSELQKLMQRLGLSEDLLKKRVTEISGGERQRLMIAVSILLKPEILLVDEPTSALDAEATKQVLSLFHEVTQKGTTILAVSHNPEFISNCNQVVALTPLT